MKKRVLKIVASLFIVSAIILSTCPATLASSFTDVTSSIGRTYLDAINYVSDNGYMTGVSSTQFSPNTAITRAAFVTVLCRISGDTNTYNDASVFTDVSSSSIYYNAIGWAVNKGIASGITSTTFAPNNTVTKQQLMTFLYRYAGLMGYDQTTNEDLTQATDYSNISAYARTPISWAYEYGIVTRDSLTESVNPYQNIDRKNTALFIARFIRNLQGVVRTRDAFCFVNSSSHFVSNGNTSYLISVEDWDRFAQNALYEGVTEARLSTIADRRWAGSCYGMAVATVLDHLGKIDLNGNYCNNADSMYDIPRLNLLTNSKHKLTHDVWSTDITISEVESKINFYQNSWFIPSVNDWVAYTDAHSGLTSMVDKLEHSGIGVFSYVKSNGGAHAIVAYGKPIETSYGYKIALYDNRNSADIRWLQITTTNSNNWTGAVVYTNNGSEVREVITKCKFQDNFSMYDIFDVDNYNNTLSTASISTLDTYAMLEVCATGDFTITNAEGMVLSFSMSDSTNPTGTMTAAGQNFIPCGTDAPCTFLFLVAPSDSFTCVAADGAEIISFYASVNGTYDGNEALAESSTDSATITASLSTTATK